MERYYALTDGQTQCYHDISSSQIDLSIQHNPKQNPKKFFCGYQQTYSKKIIWRGKRSTISKEKYKVREVILPNSRTYRNEDSMVLAKEWTHGSVEKRRKLRNRPS